MTDTERLTREQVTQRFKDRVAELGGAAKAAELYGVSGALVYMIVDGKRQPNAAMLKDMRLKRVQVPASEHWEPLAEGEE